MSEITIRYSGTLPISDEKIEEWVSEGVGIIEVSVPIGLYDLMEVGSIDGMNTYVDDRIGVSLTDLEYEIDTAATRALRCSDELVIRATGRLDAAF